VKNTYLITFKSFKTLQMIIDAALRRLFPLCTLLMQN